ncbi:MAG: DMT family protein [Kiritimatiellae bacterium]|nr:DMT family protein [Kiritimatiellia bacterium]
MSNISWVTVGMLCASNLVMAFAWYGHLKNMQNAPLWKVVLISWFIAIFEYALMIPANRIGHRTMTLEQLKITQEAISLLIFIPFSVVFMKSPITWNYFAAMICIMGAVYFIFRT